MCAVSAMIEYAMTTIPESYWDRVNFIYFKNILKRIEVLDHKMKQPDCVSPDKDQWMKDIEAYLQGLEDKVDRQK